MTIDDKIRDEKLQYDIKQQKYQHYHQVKLINMNILHAKKPPSDQRRVIEQVKFTYSALGKL